MSEETNVSSNQTAESTPDESTADEARPTRKVREGLVVSDKMEKTVVVSVEARVKHAL